MASASASIDLDNPGKYPVVLSDALLGKPSKDILTGIRYNHRPDPSSTSPSSLHLKPSDDPTTYDLSLQDNSDEYQYVGSRSTAQGQFVLIFDPVKKHFVLHRVDSTFDMNLVSTPWTQDSETLQSQYTQIEPQSQPKGKAQPPPKKAPKAAKANAALKSAPKRQKVEKPKKKPAREPSIEPEDEDSDDGLTIEYPDGVPNSYKYQSTPIFQRNISEASDEDEDAEGELAEEMNEDVDHLKLPSPANNAGGFSDDDLEMDLEAELERALDETTGNNGESSESEEE